MSEKRDEVEKIVNEIYCDLGLDGQEDWDRVSEILYRAFTKPAVAQSADHPMSAMPLAKYLNQISQNETPFEECSAKVQRAYLDKATFILGFLQPAFAAQRQAGREEREGELAAMHEAWCDDIKERYAALVEAVRRRVDPTARCDECLLTELTKALRDLDEAKGAPLDKTDKEE